VVQLRGLVEVVELVSRGSRDVRLGLILTVLAGLVLASPAFAAKVLNRGNGAEPHSLDPHRAVSTAENNIIGELILGLYTEDAAGETILGAAESAETSKDGLTWTFKIRAHTWSDGVPVTAQDFVFAHRRILDPATAAEYASALYPIKNAQKVNKGELPVDQLGVRAVDATTLVIELEHPAPFLPQLLTHYSTFPLPRHIVEKHESDWTRADKIAGNGPYSLGEWRPGDHIRLVKNKRFYDAAGVKIDEINFYPTADDNAALKRYRAGDLDTQERWPVAEYRWLKENIPSETKRTTQLSVNFVSFNMTKKPFDDVRVRRALAMAIDNEALARDIYQGVYGDAALGFLTPGTANVDLSAKVAWAAKTVAERRADAMRLLAQAGFGPARPLKFSYRYIGNPDIKRAAIALQSMWKQIGVQVELSSAEAKVHWKLLEQRDFEVSYNAWNLDYNDAKNLLFQFQSAAVQLNNSAYNSPAFEALLKAADREMDGAKRAKILGEAHALLLADVPAAPLTFPFARHLVKGYVLNWVENANNVNRTRWLDIGPGKAEQKSSSGGFWEWLASWFSGDAWSKWWNS
jgi:oligopeptide transport system substrate-binding protein